MTIARTTVQITPKTLAGPGQKMLLIAGPCQIETLDHALMVAEFLVKMASTRDLQLVYKSSFDKANRTSISGARGTGIDEGLKILARVRSEFDIPVLTDVHLPEQIPTVASVVDVLQIPAFLCRQTDLLIAAGKSGKALNIKKGQFLHPSDMSHVAAKVAHTGNQNIMLCERGASFGYRDLIVDMRSFVLMAETGYPVIFDATHSVQQIGGSGAGRSGGFREFIKPLIRGAIAVGVDGLFVECHQDPDHAPSDGPSMLHLHDMPAVIDSALRIRAATL